MALVHDDLMQWGGAERTLLAISEVFPEAPIYTSIYDSKNRLIKKKFADKKIITSFVQNLPAWRKLYRAYLPLYPIAFEQFDLSDYDLVISQTTRFAKSVITKPETRHVCYCHTPPRFLWNYSGEKTASWLNPVLSLLRVVDLVSSFRVDRWFSGSRNAAKRMKKVYRVNSEVLYPFVDLDSFKDVKTVEGDYYVVIARLNPYKRIDLAVEAFNQSGKKLKIIGVGPMLSVLKLKAKKNIQFLGSLEEKELIAVLAGSRGLLVCGEEDFGLTPLEAQALGKGVIAYGKGGVRETVVEDKTGVFFDSQDSKSLNGAIDRFEKLRIDPKKCLENAALFSKEKFQNRLLELLDQTQ